MNYDFDVLIIGGGAAGLTSAIYAVRYNLKTAVVSFDFGGQILQTGDIENWPGTKRITGPELSTAFYEHAQSLGVDLIQAYVKHIKKVPEGFEVEVDGYEKPVLFVKAIVLTTGAKHNKLGVPGEESLAGRGVSYCATCDGPFFKNKVVAVVGGGDAAVTGAVDLTANVSKVYLIHRRADFRSKPAYVDIARKNSKIEFVLNNSVEKIEGTTKVESVLLSSPFNGENRLSVDGVFIEIGFKPETSLVTEMGVELDEQGYIKVAKNQATNIPGLYAAGDVTNSSNRFAQLVTAAAEGAIAAESVFKYSLGLA